MKTYSVIKPFTITPLGIPVAIGDSVIKYDDLVAVRVGSSRITDITFYNWVGSASSLSFFTFVSEGADSGGELIAPIDTLSNYTTTDIVNKINETITVIS